MKQEELELSDTCTGRERQMEQNRKPQIRSVGTGKLDMPYFVNSTKYLFIAEIQFHFIYDVL